ncbi:NEW3 domain-containing protein [Haladaptatus sp. GCM10025893]|uniref:NEW3 domain-containing protein n=1 Tax=Haladaptatus sp. GCM10025893 TaxID=3252659 RepID=UPI00361B07CD
MENVTLDVSGLPDGWSMTATTETTADSVANGESVTANWNVTPDSTPDGDVTLELETHYEIESHRYRHLFHAELSEIQIAQWNFEDSTEDSSSYNHAFSLENGAAYDDTVAVEGEYSLQLDGSDDYIMISSDGFLHDAFTERTVSLWVKPVATTGTQVVYNEGGVQTDWPCE